MLLNPFRLYLAVLVFRVFFFWIDLVYQIRSLSTYPTSARRAHCLITMDRPIATAAKNY
jgi:hypothetical protein